MACGIALVALTLAAVFFAAVAAIVALLFSQSEAAFQASAPSQIIGIKGPAAIYATALLLFLREVFIATNALDFGGVRKRAQQVTEKR